MALPSVIRKAPNVLIRGLSVDSEKLCDLLLRWVTLPSLIHKRSDYAKRRPVLRSHIRDESGFRGVNVHLNEDSRFGDARCDGVFRLRFDADELIDELSPPYLRMHN
ncbi:hypothetical protein [Paenibacillus sp. SC116]|uniref:hypothetical protein n=1 Tax=Paenibacillus sp. SC116 TaxID=2968986 RepID=UPI00215B716C|nr:hypothetical protein [Paenibacillus sp. SC116]